MPPINPDRWRVLSPYLDEALEIAANERAAWLATLSARDAALAADLRTLLGQHQTVHESRFLECAVLDPRTASMPSTTLTPSAFSARLVTRIGSSRSA